MNEEQLWRRCEIAWQDHLRKKGWTVSAFCEAAANTSGTNAPMITLASGRAVTAPDFQGQRAGVTEYWDVKSRIRPDRNPQTDEEEHWIHARSFSDYQQLARETRCTVHVVVHEAGSATSEQRWLIIDTAAIRRFGRGCRRRWRGGEEVEAIAWSRQHMRHIEGPVVDEASAVKPVVSGEMDVNATPLDLFEPFEFEFRSGVDSQPAVSGADGAIRPIAAGGALPNDAIRLAVAKDATVGLEVLCRKLGIPTSPRYSVLRVGGGNLDDALGLLRYGIRVFLITSRQGWTHSWNAAELAAYRRARLLEWSEVELAPPDRCWIVDGQAMGGWPAWWPGIRQKVEGAETRGGINLKQYDIVHASPHADIIVTAGAGTGKTETMSERLIFLLSTWREAQAAEDSAPSRLGLDDIALVTFTREAAREMRRRIARSIALRQRLAPRCVQPVKSWLLQLGRARISTIHMFAKHLLMRTGVAIGVSPQFRISSQKREFQRLVQAELSNHLPALYAQHKNHVPPVHKWVSHIEDLWDGLENNGVPLLVLPSGPHDQLQSLVEMGGNSLSGLHKTVNEITIAVLGNLRKAFSEHCLREQAIPTSQLVPWAHKALSSSSKGSSLGLRFLFVDEFQDTDALQMALMLEVRSKLGAHLFVVGDAKQGIYRFRGAQGDAFEALEDRAKSSMYGVLAFKRFRLTQNFRSQEKLLDSMHPHFERWGQAGDLTYEAADRLAASPENRRLGNPLDLVPVQPSEKKDFARASVDVVRKWVKYEKDSSIGIICRRNQHALDVQAALRSAGIACAILVGGSFFRTPAVKELRVLLDAICDPDDDAALLELCETRWAGALLQRVFPSTAGLVPASAWAGPIEGVLPWGDRFATIPKTREFDRSDLASLRERIRSLRERSKRVAAIAFIVELNTLFAPSECALDGTAMDARIERPRYERCMTHLITLLDAQFMEGSVTLASVLDWLRIRIATDFHEDEPADPAAGEAGHITALTVHKSKGLEFDCVLLPHTWSKFGPPDQLDRTLMSVLRQREQPTPRLLWRWTMGAADFAANTQADGNGAWAIDEAETKREETRLLYVAMTRAKRRLRIMLGTHRDGPSWGDLLQ